MGGSHHHGARWYNLPWTYGSRTGTKWWHVRSPHAALAEKDQFHQIFSNFIRLHDIKQGFKCT